jgi:prepilin-type N-terminal cleavage/methylation domain-containing protein
MSNAYSHSYALFNEQGFTLLELAIVLFVLTLLLGGLLAPFAIQVEQQERRETTERMTELRDAIFGFAIINGRLPCPDCRDTLGDCSVEDMNDGVEDIPMDGDGNPESGVECRTVTGNVPWATLGASGTDAWGHRFTYRVDGDFANTIDGTNAGNCVSTPGVSFEICAIGNIAVENQNGLAVASGIPAIIVSHGKNGSAQDEWSVDEQQNNGEDTTFIEKQISPEFDDILIWISPHQLRMKMLRAGILP